MGEGIQSKYGWQCYKDEKNLENMWTWDGEGLKSDDFLWMSYRNGP